MPPTSIGGLLCLLNCYNRSMLKDFILFRWFRKILDFVRQTLRKYTLFVLHLSPHQNMLQAMLLYTFIAWIVLSLPFMTTTYIPLIDNLLTAAAAASTSGMTSVNFADSYTFLGKLVVLILIQIGGVGYMTFSFVIIGVFIKPPTFNTSPLCILQP